MRSKREFEDLRGLSLELKGKFSEKYTKTEKLSLKR
jgi:hypothetical protein